MTNEEYITLHREDDVRSLALRAVPEGVDAPWCLQQIEGWQLARRKLPRWAATEGLWFPPRLSMEQCSSELTAMYKADLLGSCGSFADLTGGFGVDFSYMAERSSRAVYVERQPELCRVARHNLPLLGLPRADVVNADCEEFVRQHAMPGDAACKPFTTVFLDPARRASDGRKVYAIEDCTPNLMLLQDALLQMSDVVMVKLSPMLDIKHALRTLRSVRECHVVSVRGECKELLFVMSAQGSESTVFRCVNLATEEAPFLCKAQGGDATLLDRPLLAGDLLFEPNASILKAGVQDAFASRYSLKKLAVRSNLFCAEASAPPSKDIPARGFVVRGVYDFGKKSLKSLRTECEQANLAIRNFPGTVAALRQRLKIKEGGSTYLYATTLSDNRHVILRCEKW